MCGVANTGSEPAYTVLDGMRFNSDVDRVRSVAPLWLAPAPGNRHQSYHTVLHDHSQIPNASGVQEVILAVIKAKRIN